MPPTVSKQNATKTLAKSVPINPPVRSAWDMVDAIRMVIYGESGTGKTTFWATFPGPIKVLICSGSNQPGELKSINTPEMRAKITPKVITSSAEMCDELADGDEFSTFVLDHASGLLGLVIKEHLNLTDIPAVKKWGMAPQRDWGFINDKCVEMMRYIFNLRCNVVIVAQEGIFKAKEDGIQSDIIKPAIGPAVTPGIGKWLNPTADYLCQTFKRAKMAEVVNTIAGKEIKTLQRVRGTDYCLRCDAPEVFMTKFRIPRGFVLPEILVDPTFGKVQAIIKGQPLEG